MGFNKRHFNMDKLSMYYEKYGENGITTCVGKTDAFFFDCDETKSVIELWSENKLEEANIIIENYMERKKDEYKKLNKCI